MVFASAILGGLIRRRLPENHLGDETEAVVKLAMGVVGTLTALVFGLLVATANSSFNASNQEVTSIAANVIQLTACCGAMGERGTAYVIYCAVTSQ
jgi:hypothetical protein